MDNQFGLDAAYFKKNLEQLARDADNYTPAEMCRALDRLLEVAQHQKNKLKPIEERLIGGDLDGSFGY